MKRPANTIPFSLQLLRTRDFLGMTTAPMVDTFAAALTGRVWDVKSTKRAWWGYVIANTEAEALAAVEGDTATKVRGLESDWHTGGVGSLAEILAVPQPTADPKWDAEVNALRPRLQKLLEGCAMDNVERLAVAKRATGLNRRNRCNR